MSVSRLVIALALLVPSACRSEPPVEEVLVSGCVSTDHTLLDTIAACTRATGEVFVFDDDVERELAQMTSTWIACFVEAGTKRSDIEPPCTLEIVQQKILRAHHRGGHDLMIDREPLPGTNTYRIYRLPR